MPEAAARRSLRRRLSGGGKHLHDRRLRSASIARRTHRTTAHQGHQPTCDDAERSQMFIMPGRQIAQGGGGEQVGHLAGQGSFLDFPEQVGR